MLIVRSKDNVKQLVQDVLAYELLDLRIEHSTQPPIVLLLSNLALVLEVYVYFFLNYVL